MSSNGASTDSSSRLHRILDQVYRSCADDPTTSVHRAWGISILMILIYFGLSMVETINLNTMGGSRALLIATVWMGIAHLLFAILGTFILKRFPTSFAIGFLVGLVLVLANQNLVLGGTYYGYRYGVPTTNEAFGVMAFLLFVVLAVFGGLLFQFKKNIIVAPIDAKGLRRNTNGGPTSNNNAAMNDPSEATSPYHRSYDKESEASDI